MNTASARRQFDPGLFAITPAAMELVSNGAQAAGLLRRHLQGDWPGLTTSQRQANLIAAARGGGYVASHYPVAAGVDVHLLTEPGKVTLMVTAAQADEMLQSGAGFARPPQRVENRPRSTN